MTSDPAGPAPPERADLAAFGPLLVVGGTGLLVAAVLAAWLVPDSALLVVAAAVALAVGAVGVLVLLRRPWLAPWVVVPVFSLAGELRLRVSPDVALSKDAVVALLMALTVVTAVGNRDAVLRRARPLAPALACWAVLVVMYVVDAAGTHSASWLFGSRLLLSALALLLAGLLAVRPDRWARSLIGALAVVLPFEAVFSWVQHLAGADALVYRWGYAYGSQVRATSGGGLRTSGTFEDPFQLAALAVIGLAVALFLARGRLAVLIGTSSVIVLAATSVRTGWLEAALLVLLFVIRRGYWKQAAVAGLVAVSGGVFLLATSTSSIRPGAPEKPLILTLNGRSTAWSNAVIGWESVAIGNGVGARGIGSTRTSAGVSSAPAYDPNAAPTAAYAGNTAFLDSTYAQVLSDVGLVGVVALLGGIGGLLLEMRRRLTLDLANSAAWAAAGLIGVTMVDWIGRASLASFSTGYLTMFVVGVLVAASTRERQPT